MDGWREILKKCIEDPKEKRRIGEHIGILSLRTLDRWAEGFSTPKNNQVIRKLGQSISQPEFDEMLQVAFPDAFRSSPHDALFTPQTRSIEIELPHEFYFRVLHAYATTPPSLRHWTITNLVGEQLVDQLDPDRMGIAVVFAQCVLKENAISFLAKDVGGSGIWDTRQLAFQSTWGDGSLINAVAADRRPYIIQALEDDPQRLLELEPFSQREKIASLAAYPVQREGALAGVLVICALQPDFFTSPRRKLLTEYTQLFALAFSDRDFYGPLALSSFFSHQGAKETSLSNFNTR